MNISPPVPTAAREVADRLIKAGHRTLFVGGCVRDWLAGQEPKDIDIVTQAQPEEILALFPNSRAVGISFGVVLVQWKETSFEVATFRTDGEYSDSRHPDSVQYSDEWEDARRRDFTINGLMMEPATGEILDYVGGLADQRLGLLRAIGEPAARFREDALRLLRAIRFSVVHDLEIERRTWDALCTHAERVHLVATERLHAELDRMWLSPRRRIALELLDRSGLLGCCVPELLRLKGCTQPPEFHPEGDVWTHTLLALEHLPEKADLELVWATLLHDIAKPCVRTIDASGRIRFNGHDITGMEMAGAILRRLRYPKNFISHVQHLVKSHMQWRSLHSMRPAHLKVKLRDPLFGNALELHRADRLASNGDLSTCRFAAEQHARLSAEATFNRSPFLNGRDLLDLGLSPGPLFRQILDEALAEQMEDRLPNRLAAQIWLRRRVKTLLDNTNLRAHAGKAENRFTGRAGKTDAPM